MSRNALVTETTRRVVRLRDGFAVVFDGKIEGARWVQEGPAQAHLDLLASGYRKPQPEIE